MRYTLTELCDWIRWLRLHSIFCIVVTYKGTFYDVTALYVRIILILKKCNESLITRQNLPECTCIISWTYSPKSIFRSDFYRLRPLVLRGHGCHIVLFITLTQIIREWHVFGRFIKWYPGSNDMLWVILQCNIPASLPIINSIINAAYSYVPVIPNINFVENIILFITTTITLFVNT